MPFKCRQAFTGARRPRVGWPFVEKLIFVSLSVVTLGPWGYLVATGDASHWVAGIWVLESLIMLQVAFFLLLKSELEEEGRRMLSLVDWVLASIWGDNNRVWFLLCIWLFLWGYRVYLYLTTPCRRTLLWVLAGVGFVCFPWFLLNVLAAVLDIKEEKPKEGEESPPPLPEGKAPSLGACLILVADFYRVFLFLLIIFG